MSNFQKELWVEIKIGDYYGNGKKKRNNVLKPSSYPPPPPGCSAIIIPALVAQPCKSVIKYNISATHVTFDESEVSKSIT